MKFSKKTLRSVKMRHIFGLQQTWSYDRYQGSGYCYGVLPALKEAAGDDQEQLAALMKSNMSFFNTSAIFSPLITGVHMALLENDSDEMGQSIKTSMMGPLAGVGDTLAGVIFNPLVTLLSCQFGLGGNWLMALLLLSLVYFLIKKFKLSALQMLILIFILAVICYYTNIFVLV